MEEFITACPRNCYSTCTFRVSVDGNRIKRISPYEGNMATPEGPCIKGLSYIERAHSPERITSPLLRSDDGTFRKIRKEEALDIISHRLSQIKKEHGPHSILWYKGSGMSGLTNEIGSQFWKAFGGATTTYGNLCWPAGLEAVRLTLGSVKHNVPWDLKNARTIIIWGKNPAETNIQEIAFIAEAKSDGSKIIVIDPLRTPTADKADILYSPVPGTDAALALAIAKVLINENLIDHKFINDNVKGFPGFRNSLKTTPDQAATITGIPADSIIELAHIIAKGSPVTFLPGYGLQRHLNGGQTIRAILSLAILTGNLGKSGAGFNYANLQSYIYDDPKEPLSYYPDKENDKPFRRTISMAKFASDLINTRKPGVKAAWVERGNPLLQLPDSENVKKAFRNLEFRVVVEQFMTDTAVEADIILPAKDMFAQSDIVGSYWSPYVQFKPKVLEPSGDIMPETEIYYHLAKKLNLDVSTELLPEPGNDNIEKWLEKRIAGHSITLKDLKIKPIIPSDYQYIAYEDMKFDTPSGMIELLSEEAEKKWGVSRLPEYNNINAEKYPYLFITPNTGSRIHSQFGNLKVIREAVQSPATLISKPDAEKIGVSDGSTIKLSNDNGSVISVARISGRVPKGIVVLYNGIWKNEMGGGNSLISGRETDMGYGAAFHDNRVSVERYDG
jgi:anaerobic selenocysteine-containing dehydrogenase